MPSQTPNHREVLAAQSTVTNAPEYLKSTAGRLLVLATISVGPAELPTSLVNGQQTVTTSPVALPVGVLTQGAVLESLSTNTVSIFVGGSGVTTSTGIELLPGGMLGVAIADTSDIYVVCASTSPVVTWLGS